MDADLRIPAVAAALDCSTQTVYRLLRRGRLRGYKVGRDWRVKPHAVDHLKQPIDPPATAIVSRRRVPARSIEHLPGAFRYASRRP